MKWCGKGKKSLGLPCLVNHGAHPPRWLLDSTRTFYSYFFPINFSFEIVSPSETKRPIEIE
jgi:hypothetical protein